ncbi:MAG TPA: TRAP transporter TatT component family protein [Lacunisphaera sp.]|nr:TRAP transporter TatT component family protein [Lacunisphaera sp.]
MKTARLVRGIWFGTLALGLGGCATVNRVAVNKLGDALAGGGTVFAGDNDPDLVREAAPFSLKLMESLLAATPDHTGLRLAAASGFTQYAYAFVQADAEAREETDVTAAAALRARACRLYLRGRDHGLRGLESVHTGFGAALRQSPRQAVQSCRRSDVPLLYWTAAAWASAIAVGKDRPELIADLPQAEALIDRALVLDEAYDHGAIHAFLAAYELSRPGGTGDPVERARVHYERAVALSEGGQAGPFLTYAENVCVRRQDRAQFESLLRRALAIDPDARPEWRLVNLIMQARARRLLAQADDLFLAATPAN